MEGVNSALFGDKRAQLNTPSRWAEAHKGANSAHRHFQPNLIRAGQRLQGGSRVVEELLRDFVDPYLDNQAREIEAPYRFRGQSFS